MVDDSAIFWTYLPFAPDGLAFTIASTNASKLARRSSAGKLASPIPEWMMPAFSTRNSTWPPLAAFTAAATFGEIGREHVCTPVTNEHLVCRLQHEKKTDKKQKELK